MLEDLAIATGGAADRGRARHAARGPAPGDAGPGEARADHPRDDDDRRGRRPAAAVARRCAELRQAIEREKYLSYDREQLQQRLARLVSGIAVLRVGGATETALKERKQRAEAAVNAVRAAAAGGILPGGGAALVHASKALGGLEAADVAERAAIGFVRQALCAPARQIAANPGSTARWSWPGCSIRTTRISATTRPPGATATWSPPASSMPPASSSAALRNAASTAARILTTEAAVTPGPGGVSWHAFLRPNRGRRYVVFVRQAV